MILSFIIPLYNCEQYIFRCLEQICSSDVNKDDYEIIVINDGSNDGSDSEIQRFKNKHSSCNLTYIVTENRGASDARNLGIEKAEGDFVWFVDADDLIEPSFFLFLIKHLVQCEDDLICFNHVIVSNHESKQIEEFREEIHLSGIEYLNRHPYNYVWNKVFRRSSIGNHRFLHGIKNTEDWLFIMISIINMHKVTCIPEIGYYYNTSNTSSTLRNRTHENLKKNYNDTQLVHKTLLDFIQQQKDDKATLVLKKALNYNVIGFFYAMFVDRMPANYVSNVINKYKSLGLYPPQKSFSKKAEKFRVFLQLRSVFLLAIKMREHHDK